MKHFSWELIKNYGDTSTMLDNGGARNIRSKQTCANIRIKKIIQSHFS